MTPPAAVGRWRLALRVDASPEIGHGHVARSIALGQALISYGADPVVVARAPLQSVPLPVIEIPTSVSSEREAAFLAALEPRPVAVIADLFRPTQEQVIELAKGPWSLVFLDDGASIEFDADLVVSPNLSSVHTHRCTARTVYLHGPRALILRPEFREFAPRTIRARASELLVCLGGSDPADATGRVVEALLAAFPPAVERVTIILGPGYGGDVVSPDGRFVIVRNARDMYDRMRRADIAILAAGNLLHEAMATGLPSVLIDLTPEQARDALVAHECGAAVWLGGTNGITAAALTEALAQLIDYDARQRLSIRAREVFDPKDADRLVERVAFACTRRGRSR